MNNRTPTDPIAELVCDCSVFLAWKISVLPKKWYIHKYAYQCEKNIFYFPTNINLKRDEETACVSYPNMVMVFETISKLTIYRIVVVMVKWYFMSFWAFYQLYKSCMEMCDPVMSACNNENPNVLSQTIPLSHKTKHW